MGKHNIEKFSLGYRLLNFYGKFIHECLYHKYYIFNRPKRLNEAHIFVSNHQNALMDAMAILFSSFRTVIFLARSDIFRNPKVAFWLYFLRILPVYRIRDGFSNLKNNEEIFNTTIRVINYPRSLTMFPEGSHTHLKRLRELQKGFARIAFQTIERNGNDKPFWIIPIGLDYENFQKYGTDLIINYGQPVNINEYYPLYCQNPAVALNTLCDVFHDELKKLMIHIETDDWYDLTFKLININTLQRKEKGIRHFDIFQENRKLATVISEHKSDSEKMISINNDTDQLYKILKKSKLQISELSDRKKLLKNLLITVFLIPPIVLSMPAIIALGWFYALLKNLANKKIKDTQFRTSVRFGALVVISIPLILIIPLISLFFLPGIYYPILVVMLYLSGLLALKTVPRFKRYLMRLKSSILHLFGVKKIKSAIHLKTRIQSGIDDLLKK